MTEENKNVLSLIVTLFLAILPLIATIWGCFALYAEYNVWSSGLAGQAQLKQAEWSRQIAVRESQAKRDSAIMLAQAEVERAKGVAQANKIIGDSLRNNEEYLRYLWIDSIQNTKNQIVYVPTEANLPILESGRHIVNTEHDKSTGENYGT